jgi:hypothetical protein
MMIGVPPSPDHPVAPAHVAKDRMYTESRSIGKFTHLGNQF